MLESRDDKKRKVPSELEKYVFVDFSSEEEVKKTLKCDWVYMGGRYIKVFREKHVPTAKGPLQNSPLSELHYPINSLTKKPQGRMLHGLLSTIRKEASEDADNPSSSYKKKKVSKDKASSSSSHDWNTLFMGPNAMADAIAQKYSASKSLELDHMRLASFVSTDPLGESVQGWTPVEFFLGKTRSTFQPCGKGHPLILPVGCFLHGPLPFLKTLEASLSVEVDGKPETKDSVAVCVALGETQLGKRCSASSSTMGSAWTPSARDRLHLALLPPCLWWQVACSSTLRCQSDQWNSSWGTRRLVIHCQGLHDSVRGWGLTAQQSCPAVEPADTLAAELRETFGRFGSLGQVLLPKVGVTAILEFLEPLDEQGLLSPGLLPGALLSMGFAFVEYRKPEQAQKALKQLQVSGL
ncbi:putative RNA-binding protein 19 [Sciurus carolinensis]|uniref:RNA-binding protein 19 n=1 Tax=Sciurus carolinensis TaxID=30640 RepID=A0AA41MM46_SCICA|nr:putative RNA-binding protein 19 [Sciurus carolinensis]